MSPLPAQFYVRPLFSPNQSVIPGRPIYWDNGSPKGGKVLAEGELFFVYVFETEDGRRTASSL